LDSRDSSEKLSRVVIPPGKQVQANRLARTGRLLTFFKGLLFAAVLAGLIVNSVLTGLPLYYQLPPMPSLLVNGLILIGIFWLLSIPFDFYKDFILARRYGLSVQGFGAWLSSYIRNIILISVLAVGLVAIVYLAIVLYPEIWWLLIWAFLMIVSIILNLLLPGVLTPLFFKSEPISDKNLKKRFLTLSANAGVSIKGVYRVGLSDKETTANAALVGIGKGKRILLSDTLLTQYSDDEIEAVIAHELGHIKNRDTAGMFLFQTVVIFACLWLTAVIVKALTTPLGFDGIEDVAILPLFVLVFVTVNIIFTPLSNALMRSFEIAADDFALRLTRNPEAFIAMITKLNEQNPGETLPPLWVEFLLNDHPVYHRRISYAKGFILDREERQVKE